jgi:hypothetical protein
MWRTTTRTAQQLQFEHEAVAATTSRILMSGIGEYCLVTGYNLISINSAQIDGWDLNLILMEHFSHKLGKIFGYFQQKNSQLVATVKCSLTNQFYNLPNLASSFPH